MTVELHSPMSGLERMRAMAAGTIPAAPVGALIGMVIRDVGHGRVSFDLPVGEHLYNPLGTVHGGMTSTILDSAMGCAVSTTLAAGWGWTTLDLHVTFTKGITTAVGTITAVGEVVTTGRRVATATGRVVGPDGTLYATATTTCLVMPPR